MLGLPSARFGKVYKSVELLSHCSRVFHRQWLQKPPTAGCLSTSIFCAHFTIYHLSETIVLTSFGNVSIPADPRIEPGGTTHRKGWLLHIPQAISTSSLLSIWAGRWIYTGRYEDHQLSQVLSFQCPKVSTRVRTSLAAPKLGVVSMAGMVVSM